jgi:hypothetical protein
MPTTEAIQISVSVGLDAARALDRLVAQRQAAAGPRRRITRSSIVREALERLVQSSAPAAMPARVVRERVMRRKPAA